MLPFLESPRYRGSHPRQAFELVVHMQRYWTAQHIRACRKAIRQGFYLACSIDGRQSIDVKDAIILQTINLKNKEACAWHHDWHPVPIVHGLELEDDRQRYARHEQQSPFQAIKIIGLIGFVVIDLLILAYVFARNLWLRW